MRKYLDELKCKLDLKKDPLEYFKEYLSLNDYREPSHKYQYSLFDLDLKVAIAQNNIERIRVVKSFIPGSTEYTQRPVSHLICGNDIGPEHIYVNVYSKHDNFKIIRTEIVDYSNFISYLHPSIRDEMTIEDIYSLPVCVNGREPIYRSLIEVNGKLKNADEWLELLVFETGNPNWYLVYYAGEYHPGRSLLSSAQRHITDLVKILDDDKLHKGPDEFTRYLKREFLLEEL